MKRSNVMMSGIPGTNKTAFAQGMAAHSALSGTVMDVISFGKVKHILRHQLGYTPTPFQIFSEIMQQARTAGNADRLVAFDAPNLTFNQRVRALTNLSSAVKGSWMLCQVHALPEQACKSYVAQRYRKEISEGRYQRHLKKIKGDFSAMQIARPIEGFDTVLHFDMNGEPLTEAEAANILYR